jgi:hypothetical protein
MTDLLKEAIADAKAVREVALANAKFALEEAFTPRLQSMLSMKLSEEAEGDEEDSMTEEEEDEMQEGDEMDYESEMEEGEDHEDEPVEEGEFLDDQDRGIVGEDDMTDDEDEMPDMPESDEEVDFDEDEDEEIDEDLMEIIRQLEEELDSSEIGKGDNKQPSASASDDHTEMKKEPLVQVVNEEEEDEMVHEEDDIDIQEIIRALREEEEEDDKMHEEEHEEASANETDKAEMEEKLQEAYAVVQFLREKLNEVNLLNSKLLFSNKLFRSHSLTESQKMNVIENFDRAGSLREVKLVYATLAEALKGKSNRTPKAPKKSLKESFNAGASRPQASTRPSKAIISESNSMTDRFKKLAGLI